MLVSGLCNLWELRPSEGSRFLLFKWATFYSLVQQSLDSWYHAAFSSAVMICEKIDHNVVEFVTVFRSGAETQLLFAKLKSY